MKVQKQKEQLQRQQELNQKRKEEQALFVQKWKTTTPDEKLDFYKDVKKLKLLCKRKGIRGYSKCDRNTLIGMLKGRVDESDFPIRE